jgi:ubiquitin-protein ligase
MSRNSKQEQVTSLMRAVPLAANRSPGDDSIFDVGIKISDQKVLTLRAELPYDFPSVPPILRILDPGATHPWLDSSGRVAGLSELYNWDPRTSDLGVVMQKALLEFMTRPPHINPAVKGVQKVRENWVSNSSSSSSQRNINQEEARQAIRLDIPDSFPELDSCDAKQLQDLLDNENNLMQFYKTLSVVSNTEQLVDSVLKGNKEKAKDNLSASDQVVSLQTNIEQLQQDLNKSRQALSDLQARQRAFIGQLDPRKLGESFEALARTVDQQSDDVASSMFDNGALDEEALRKFRALRVLYHLRKGKADRCRAQFLS